MKKGERINIMGNAIFTGNETPTAVEIEVMAKDFLHERFWIPKTMAHEIKWNPIRISDGIQVGPGLD